LARLYLIRRNIESFIGPVTVDGMREAYKRMAFGLQDEVCGHAGDWVSFDDIEKLKNKYPDVAKVVSEDMLAGWGVGENTGMQMLSDETGEVFVSNRNRSMRMAMAFLVVAVVAFAAAIYLSKKGRLSGKTANGLGVPTVEQMSDYVQANQIDQLVNDVDSNRSEIVANAIKSKNSFVSWIPYLRMYAFEKDGEITGIRPKLLRGTGATSAPTDCSLNIWRRRWKNSVKKWPAFLQGKKLVRAHWARILAWDPHWIARRTGKGWVHPKNYYIGCIDMARKALNEVSTGNSVLPGANFTDWKKHGLAEVNLRLDWLYRVSLGGVIVKPEKPNSQMSRWICYESARDFRELDSCNASVKNDDDIAAYGEERYGWNVVRLVTQIDGEVTTVIMNKLTAQYSKLRRSDHFTRFDYRPELKFIKTLVKQGGSVDNVVGKITKDFPDVNLSH
jgi:hypothetical protein